MSSQFIEQQFSSDEDQDDVPLIVLDADLSGPIDDYDGVPRTQYACPAFSTLSLLTDTMGICSPGTLLYLTHL